MRKKQQAIHISKIAKKNFCKEISLNDYTYEDEIKEQLIDYFNTNIKDEDIDDNEENSNVNSDDDSFEISNIEIGKGGANGNKEFVKFQISDKATLSKIDNFNYDLIPKKTANIGEKGEEKLEENNREIGNELKMSDIIKQYIFWKENCDEEEKKNCQIEPLDFFNLNPEKMKIIKQKITELKKIAKDKKMDEPTLNKFLKELENNYTEKRKELNNLVNDFDKIEKVSYGKNFSIVEYKK